MHNATAIILFKVITVMRTIRLMRVVLRANVLNSQAETLDSPCYLSHMLLFPPQSVIVALQFYLIGHELQM